MRRPLALIVAIAVSAASVALAMDSQVEWCQVQPATASAPSGDAGISLQASPPGGGQGAFLRSIHTVLSCPTGWQLLDAGSEACWFQPNATGRWTTCPSYANVPITAIGQDFVSAELQVTNPFGRLFYATVGVICDAGSTWDGGAAMCIEGYANE